MKRRINNQQDADKLRFTDVIISTCFGHHYAHHQEYRSAPTDRLFTVAFKIRSEDILLSFDRAS
jgi:hypothetical protein